jgi:hypothetical protein
MREGPTPGTPCGEQMNFVYACAGGNGALFPGRVPHVRQSVHPDFLWTLLALANFMRLSLMKAAYADVGGAPCRKSGYMGRKDGRSPFQRFCYIRKKTAAKSQNPPPIE